MSSTGGDIHINKIKICNFPKYSDCISYTLDILYIRLEFVYYQGQYYVVALSESQIIFKIFLVEFHKYQGNIELTEIATITYPT